MAALIIRNVEESLHARLKQRDVAAERQPGQRPRPDFSTPEWDLDENAGTGPGRRRDRAAAEAYAEIGAHNRRAGRPT